MAQHEVETQWMGKMQFNSSVFGHSIVMDAPERVGGENRGPIPKPFILTALSGCTGMDVVSFLRKEGIELKGFDLNVVGELSKQAPIVYTAVHIIYRIEGDANHQQAVWDAIQLSQEQYCGVSFMLKKIMPVTWEIHFNGKMIFDNKPKMQTDNQVLSGNPIRQ